MSDVARLEAELAMAKLAEEDGALYDKAYADGASAKDIAAFKEHNAKVAEARREFKEQFTPTEPEAGDAAPTPATVKASAKAKKG